MVGSLSAQVALLAFAAAIAAGVYAGNAATTVLTRAIVAMFVAYVIGRISSSAVKLVLRDHLQRKKRSIDEAHAAAMKSAEVREDGDEAAAVETG
jgi:hypothetical protein